jgi:hypothetical protein
MIMATITAHRAPPRGPAAGVKLCHHGTQLPLSVTVPAVLLPCEQLLSLTRAY